MSRDVTRLPEPSSGYAPPDIRPEEYFQTQPREGKHVKVHMEERPQCILFEFWGFQERHI